METLLIGGTGFIGRKLCTELANRGHRVRVLSRQLPEQPLPAATQHFRGDLSTMAGVADAMVGCDGIVLLAGREDLPFMPRGDTDGAAMFEINVLGTHRCLLAAREAGVKQAVVVTSASTFGVSEDGTTLDGRAPVNVGLHSPYVYSRIQQELAALQTARDGFRVTIAGPSAVVGVGDDKFFGPLVDSVRQFPMLAVPPGGFNFIAVRDVVTGIAQLLEGKGQRLRYLIVGENLTYRELFGLIAAECGRPVPRMPLPPTLLRAVARVPGWLSMLIGRKPAASAGLIELFLNQKVFYDGRVAVAEIGLPQTPIRPVIRDAVRRIVASE